MYEIIPGILEKEWSEIERKLNLVKPFAKVIHIDLLDGKFAPNTTVLDPKPFAKYSKDFIFELHMMVNEPIQYLQPFADAGFQRFLGHIEKMSSQDEFVALAQTYGEVGLVLDKDTPVDAIKVPLDDLDVVFVMTIKAGFSGQAFMPELLGKVKTLREKTSLPIEVDGGISDTTITQAKEAGATRFITTSFLFKSENCQEQYEKLKHLIA